MRSTSWTSVALADLTFVIDYFDDKAPEYAERLGDQAVESGRFLADHPFAGASIAGSDYRKWRIGKSPFLLIYKVLPDSVQILRLRPDRSDWRTDL